MTMAAGPLEPLPPGRLPPRRPTIESLSKKQRDERRKVTPNTRLTTKLTRDLANAVSIGTPLNIACDLVGIHPDTFRRWMKWAAAAEVKHWNDRTQIERRCIMLKTEVTKAQGQAGSRTHLAIARAAGLTRDPVTSKVVTSRIVGTRDAPITVSPDGQVSGGEVEEVVVETREHPPEWRAAVALAKYRFPADMGEPVLTGADSATAAAVSTGVTAAMMVERLRQIAEDRQAAGVDGATEVIDSTALASSSPDDR